MIPIRTSAHLIVFDAEKISPQRLEVSFSPDLVINALIQASDASQNLGLNLRLNWHYRPGSDLFVVYNHGWDLPDLDRFDDLSSRARQLVVKWTWAWQS